MTRFHSYSLLVISALLIAGCTATAKKEAPSSKAEKPPVTYTLDKRVTPPSEKTTPKVPSPEIKADIKK